MVKSKIEKKIDLLLRAWYSDKDDLSNRAVDEEKKIMREIKEILK